MQTIQTQLANALERSLCWLEANTDDDPAIVPAMIQAYIALAQYHGVDPLTLRQQRTTPTDRMPQVVEGIGDSFESEWDWCDQIARQFRSHYPDLTAISIRLIDVEGFTIQVETAGGKSIAACHLNDLDPVQAHAVLEVVQLCWRSHGFCLN